MIKNITLDVVTHRGGSVSSDVMYRLDPEHDNHPNNLDTMTSVELGTLKAYLRELVRAIGAAEDRRYRAEGGFVTEFEAR